MDMYAAAACVGRYTEGVIQKEGSIDNNKKKRKKEGVIHDQAKELHTRIYIHININRGKKKKKERERDDDGEKLSLSLSLALL